MDAVLWETDGQDSLYAGSLVDLTVAPGSSDLDVLAGVEGSEVIALATADARLLGVAPLGADGTLAGPFSAGLFYLADMGNAMASSRYTNRADADSCGPSATSALEQTPVEALVNYFGANGGATGEANRGVTAGERAWAESIALQASTSLDPVTGISVLASLPHIERQLAAGVSESEIEIRWTVPVLVTLPPEPDLDAILVFHDGTTGAWIGWIDTIPEGWHPQRSLDDQDSESVKTTAKVYLTPPDIGHNLVVVLRHREELVTECPLSDADQPLLVVPFDDVAGASRAYELVTVEDLDAVSRGDFAP